uniref:DUF148 domain-containing protein n=1 Tax=Steinernema glaseri TaxID=37863 RepID=A0A1I7Z634_9BILA
MFVLSSFLLVLTVSNAAGLQVPNSGEDKELYDSLPKVFQEFYSKLNESDLDLLESMSADLKGKTAEEMFKTAEEMFKVIKPKSESLAKNVRDFSKKFFADVDKMSNEAKDFMKEIFESFTGISENEDDETDEDFIRMSQNLSKDAKKEIMKAFPSMKTFFDENGNAKQ